MLNLSTTKQSIEKNKIKKHKKISFSLANPKFMCSFATAEDEGREPKALYDNELRPESFLFYLFLSFNYEHVRWKP